ncbi:unnamed protein product, partial [Cylindrotheca closterium]
MPAAEFQHSSMGSDVGTLTSETNEEPAPDKVLAHVTKHSSLQPGELQRVMSDKLALVPATKHRKGKQEAKNHEIVIDGVRYKACATPITYSVLRVSTRKNLALVDRGANGGIAGDDVRIIVKTNRSVDVQGIDNHQVTNVTIATCAGLTMTQRGPAIVIMNQFAHIGKGQSILSSAQMEHFGIQVDDKSSKVGGKQQISTPDGFVIPLDIKNGLPYLRMRPPTDRELSNPDIPHVVLTSDVDWDPSVLDVTIDVDEWAKSIPDNGSEEGERPFDRVGTLKSNTTVTTLRDSPALDDAIDFFESHHCVMPTDGLYEVHPRQASDLDWFECNMAELFDLDPTYVTPIIPPEFEVYESRRRPSVLFVPEAPTDFDIESTPLRDKVIDSSHKSSCPEPRHSSRRKTHSEDGRWNSKDKWEQPGPPPRDPHTYESVPVVEPVYKNPSSAVKSCERDWERLRRYFAWLPKLVIQKTFDCTTQLARIPMSAHLQRHYCSPFPALNVNRCSEGVATDTVYADTPDIEHGHVAAQFYVGISSLVSDVYGVNT